MLADLIERFLEVDSLTLELPAANITSVARLHKEGVAVHVDPYRRLFRPADPTGGSGDLRGAVLACSGCGRAWAIFCAWPLTGLAAGVSTGVVTGVIARMIYREACRLGNLAKVPLLLLIHCFHRTSTCPRMRVFSQRLRTRSVGKPGVTVRCNVANEPPGSDR